MVKFKKNSLLMVFSSTYTCILACLYVPSNSISRLVRGTGVLSLNLDKQNVWFKIVQKVLCDRELITKVCIFLNGVDLKKNKKMGRGYVFSLEKRYIIKTINYQLIMNSFRTYIYLVKSRRSMALNCAVRCVRVSIDI